MTYQVALAGFYVTLTPPDHWGTTETEMALDAIENLQELVANFVRAQLMASSALKDVQVVIEN
jgi:hypothetical protein